jgi:hypothetical protein
MGVFATQRETRASVQTIASRWPDSVNRFVHSWVIIQTFVVFSAHACFSRHEDKHETGRSACAPTSSRSSLARRNRQGDAGNARGLAGHPMGKIARRGLR